MINPEKYKDTDSLVSEYYELRKAKGITPEEARSAVTEDYITFGAMLVRRQVADEEARVAVIRRRGDAVDENAGAAAAGDRFVAGLHPGLSSYSLFEPGERQRLAADPRA